MKALIIATFIIGGTPDTPVRTVTTNQLEDQSSCKSAMVVMVEHAGLKNHVYSSGPTYIKARKGGANGGTDTSIEVTCKPIKGE